MYIRNFTFYFHHVIKDITYHNESRHVERLIKKNPFLRPGTTCYRGHRCARRIGTKS